MTRPTPRSLIVTTKADQKNDLSAVMEQYGLESICCETSKSARELLRSQNFSVVFCEDGLPDGGFRSLLRDMGQRTKGTPMIVVSAQDDWDTYLESLRAKAFDRLTFPTDQSGIEQVLLAALSESRQEAMPGPWDTC